MGYEEGNTDWYTDSYIVTFCLCNHLLPDCQHECVLHQQGQSRNIVVLNSWWLSFWAPPHQRNAKFLQQPSKKCNFKSATQQCVSPLQPSASLCSQSRGQTRWVGKALSEEVLEAFHPGQGNLDFGAHIHHEGKVRKFIIHVRERCKNPGLSPKSSHIQIKLWKLNSTYLLRK